MVLLRNIFMVLSVLSGSSMVLGYLFSSPKASGLGAIGGTAQKFKVRKHRDIFLDKIIIISAIVFGACILFLSLINPEVWKQ